jgi:membrane dipeptidase
VPGFLGRGGDINALLDHIDHVTKLCGADHVAIGTDTPHCSPNRERELKRIARQPGSRPRWEAFWPEGSLTSHTCPQEDRLSLSWTNWPLLTVGLVQRGYSDDDIQRIIGGNFLRVARDVLSGLKPSQWPACGKRPV